MVRYRRFRAGVPVFDHPSIGDAEYTRSESLALCSTRSDRRLSDDDVDADDGRDRLCC